MTEAEKLVIENTVATQALTDTMERLCNIIEARVPVIKAETSDSPSDEGLPSVSGMLEGSLADHERSLLVKLMDEQEKINPDNSLISVLCNAVRVSREYVRYMEPS